MHIRDSKRYLVLLALATLAIVPVAVGSTAQPARTRVSIYPTAGTTTANPHSQISFRGVQPGDLGHIRVVGSHSGKHSGHLAAHSDGNGASFLLDHPLAPAETVTVRANQPLVGAGRDGALMFKTSAPVKGFVLKAPDDDGGDPDQSQHFRTEPNLLPPSIWVLTGHAGGSSDIFTSPKIKKGQDGAMINDPNGHLVWFHPAPTGMSIYDLRAQTYLGNPVLTWWQGRILNGKGIGQGVIWDDSYRQIARVRAANGYRNDEHEFKLTPQGTALITVDVPVTYDLRSVDGPKHGAVYDSAVQEVDVRTGLVVFEWHSIGQLPFTDSDAKYNPRRGALYDPFHINSIDPEPNGNLLVSARNSSAIYELSRHTGKIRWRLGGKRSSFAMGPGTRFVGQHDARRNSNGTISVFDNGAGIKEQGYRPGRGLVLAADVHKRRVKLLHELTRKNPTPATSQGNVQLLPNGHYFVGWGGSSPYLSEFDQNGSLVFDGELYPVANNSYRAYRFPWHGRPTYPPAVAAQQSSGGTDVWASWNGATDVASWELLGGTSPQTLAPAGTFPRTGFETAISVPATLKYVAVRAHDANGAILGTSHTVAVK